MVFTLSGSTASADEEIDNGESLKVETGKLLAGANTSGEEYVEVEIDGGGGIGEGPVVVLGMAGGVDDFLEHGGDGGARRRNGEEGGSSEACRRDVACRRGLGAGRGRQGGGRGRRGRGISWWIWREEEES